jgi:hypothetical protein
VVSFTPRLLFLQESNPRYLLHWRLGGRHNRSFEPLVTVGTGTVIPRVASPSVVTIATGRWRSWLTHCATNRKVVGSIPDGVTEIFLSVGSASNRNEYQEYFLGGKGSWCVRLTIVPPSCTDCLQIWEPQPPGTLRACPGL